MMILLTGNSRARRRRGITFVEVMLTVVILSGGLVAIYRSFLSGIDYLDRLSTRVYAINLLENRMAVVEKDFRSPKDFDIGLLDEEFVINHHPVMFHYKVDLKPVGTLLSVFELEMEITWRDHGRVTTLSRTAYVSGVTSLAPVPEKGA
ncbi:MAG: hypothetical protein WCI27_00870 [Candidatus Omnitrophota bacterium]